jgi:hypothetical protein
VLGYAQEALVNRALGSTLFWIGLGLGAVVGYTFAVCRRAFRDFRTVKDSVPGMRTKAWGSLGQVLIYGVVAVVLVVGSVAWIAGWRPLPSDATPASVPSKTVPASVPSAPASATRTAASPSPRHR